MYFAAIALLSIALSCKEKAYQKSQEAKAPEETQQLKETNSARIGGKAGITWNNYLQIKAALVNTDANGVKQAAGKLAESLVGDQSELKSLARQMTETEDIDAQRRLFSDFVQNAESLFRDALSEGSIYKQYCPMAFGGEGAYWLSDQQAIRNPYFGDQMLKCGEVVEEISNQMDQ